MFSNLAQFITTITEYFNRPPRGVDGSEGVTSSDVKQAIIDLGTWVDERVLDKAEIVDLQAKSLAQLRTISNASLEKGYNFSSLDGDTWQYDASDNSSPDDGAMVLVTNDGKRIKRIVGDIVYPEQFGAVGNGVANDTLAIQKGLDFVEGKKKTLKFRNANYRITYSLLYGSDCNIEGSGMTYLFFDTTTQGSILASRSFLSSYFSVFGPVKNVTISGLNLKAALTGYGNGISVSRGKNIKIDNIYMDAAGSSIAHIADIVGQNILITRCTALNLGGANGAIQIDNLEAGTTNAQWLTLVDGTELGISMDASFRSENVQVTNNYVENCYHAVHFHRNNQLTAGAKASVIVANNIFVNCQVPIYFDPNKFWDGIRITNNIIQSNSPRFQAMLLNSDITRLDVAGNTFLNYANIITQTTVNSFLRSSSYSDNTAYCENSSLTPADRRAINIAYGIADFTISNNRFENYDRGVNSVGTANVTNLFVTGNRFYDMKDRAVGLDRAVGFSVTNNFINRVNQDYDSSLFDSSNFRTYPSSAGKAGIVINQSSNGVIANNHIENVKSAAIAFNSNVFSNISVRNNYARNVTTLVTTISNATPAVGLVVHSNELEGGDYTMSALYIISVNSLTVSNNNFRKVLFNGIDIRNGSRVEVNGNYVTGNFTSGVDRKAIVWTTCSDVIAQGNRIDGYRQVAGNVEYWINGINVGTLNISNSLGWANPGNTTSCRIFYNSNNLPTSGQVGRFAVGSIITNDNNTLGVPNGEPTSWICVQESDTSVFVPCGQIGVRTVAGSPVTAGTTPFFQGEDVYDSTNNRWFKSRSTTAGDWVLMQNQFLSLSTTLDLPSISAGSFYSQDFTMPGATVAMFAIAALLGDTASLIIDAKVKAADTVRVTFFNPTLSSVDYPSLSLSIRVLI